MPPKNKKAASAEKQKDVQETEDPFQAVVLADSFETRFSPLTLEKPRCLLPLANTPLIEYTLQFLANAGLDEVYLYCGAHTDQLEDYIQQSRWSKPSSPFTLEILRSTSRSIGDAMRDLDKRNILANDFIVVYGDVVSNLPLDAALSEHRARRVTDKNAIMTMVLREAGTEHRTKAHGTSPVFVVDPSKQRCLHYEQIVPSKQHSGERHVSVDPELLSSHEELELRHDLIDCGIDICTPDVLALWSDNFDYESPRRGFLHSVLKDYELNGKTIHTHIVRERYAARVRNLKAYDSVSKDIMGRWVWPIAPDSNLTDGQTYTSRKGNIFIEDTARFKRTSKIGPKVVLGAQTTVDTGTEITRSVIGSNCCIGKNCVIEDSYIWDRTTIGDETEIRNSILASDVNVGRECKIEDGSLISYAVKLSDGVSVKKRRITTVDASQDQTIKSDALIVGEVGIGHEFEPSDSEDDDTMAGISHSIYKMNGLSLSTESISTIGSDSLAEEMPIHNHPSSGSFASNTSDDSHGVPRSAENFQHDASSSIYDSFQKGHEVSTIQLELQGLRMAANATEHQVRRAVATALMKHLLEVRRTSGAAAGQTMLKNNNMLIERTIFDKDSEEKPDQVDFLLLSQAELSKSASGEAALLCLCNDLYLSDSLEEEGIMQWWTDPRSTASEAMRKVRGKTAQFITALQEAESESEEDE